MHIGIGDTDYRIAHRLSKSTERVRSLTFIWRPHPGETVKLGKQIDREFEVLHTPSYTIERPKANSNIDLKPRERRESAERCHCTLLTVCASSA